MLFFYKGWDQITPGFSAPTNPFPGSSAFPGGWELPVEIGSTFLFKPEALGLPWAGPQQSFRPGLASGMGRGFLCPCGSSLCVPAEAPFVFLRKCFQVAPWETASTSSPSPLTSM